MEKSYFIPNNFNSIILKKKFKKIILTYNFILSFIFSIPLNSYYNIVNNSVSTKTTNLNFYKAIYKLIWSVFIINIKTIKFVGKGFRLTKYKDDLIFLFQHSHMYELKKEKLFIKKPKKNKIWISCTNIQYLNNVSKKIKDIRPVKFYTKNGLRLKRQIIYKRKGKTIMT